MPAFGKKLFALAVTLLLPLLAAGSSEQVKPEDPSPSQCRAEQATAEMSFDILLTNVRQCASIGDFKSALKVAYLTKTRASLNGSYTQRLTALIAEGAILQHLGLYSQAMESYEQVLAFAHKDDFETIAKVENNLAHLYIKLDNYDEALKLSSNAVEHIKDRSQPYALAIYSGTLSASLLHQNRLDEAQHYIDECSKHALLVKDNVILTYCRKTAAEIALAQKKPSQANTLAKSAIDFALKNNISVDLPDLYLVQAKALSHLRARGEAEQAAVAGIKLAESQNDPESALALWQFRQQQFEEADDKTRAFDMSKEIQRLNKRIYDSSLANALAFQNVQMDILNKEHQIKSLEAANEISNAEANLAKIQRTATIAIAILIVIIVFIGYSRWIHKRDLQRAEETNRQHDHLHELKDQFLANTSHELRTPLNGIIGLSDLLIETESNNLTAVGRTQLGLIRDCGAQLSDMVDSILDFSQIRAGKHVIQIRPVLLGDVITNVFAILQPLAQRKGLKLEFVSNEKNVQVLADENRLRQILTNLIGNAIKFTDKGEVTVAVIKRNSNVLISVRDTGVGIPEDRLLSIFEPFEQVDGSLRRRQGGVGLGLAIVKELLQAHGTSIGVRSEIGLGTEFRFSLASA